MKNWLMGSVLALSCVSAQVALAGPHCGHGDGHFRDGFQRMVKKLDLSAEQKLEIKAIRDAHQAANGHPNMEKAHQAMSALDPESSTYARDVAAFAKAQAAEVEAWIKQRADMKAKIYAVLTPEQKTKWKTLRAERKN